MNAPNTAERYARRTDPTTSHDAAASLDRFRDDHKRQITRVLTLHTDGLTVYDIASLCNIDAHAVGKRMKEMETAGEVEVVRDILGEVKKPTPSGRSARTWRRVVAQIGGVQ